MAKKRSCRRTEEEERYHEIAVKLRKMTDIQLVKYMEEKVEEAERVGHSKGKKEGMKMLNGNNVANFIAELSMVKGVGSTTINKIKAYAVEKKYMEEQEAT